MTLSEKNPTLTEEQIHMYSSFSVPVKSWLRSMHFFCLTSDLEDTN